MIRENFAMNYKEQIIQGIEQIPEPLLGEVLDFIEFLKQKHPLPETLETAILSQS